MEWKKTWPDKEGKYWFYGYRYGKVSCGFEQKKEYCFVTVNKCSNGFMTSSEGQFMFENEVEDAYFKECELPEPPKEDR